MIPTNIATVAATVLLTIGGSALVFAQTQNTPSSPSMMADCPMMRGTSAGPDYYLREREALKLTDQQIARLEGVQQRISAARTEATAVLTNEQRETLKKLTGRSGMSMQHMHSMMMAHCPMMKHMQRDSLQTSRQPRSDGTD